MALDALFLPLLLPPSAGGSDGGDSGTATGSYADYAGAYEVRDVGDGSLTIEASNPDLLPETITVVTPQPGVLTVLPTGAGATLPNGAPATGETVVLSVYPDAVAGFEATLPGRPAPGWWAFTGIDPASLQVQLDGWASAASDQQLDSAWLGDTSPATVEISRENYVARVLAGEIDVPLEAGTAIGDLASGAYLLGVRLFDPKSEPVHPAIALPGFAEANPALVGHPALAGIGAVDIDVQIFVQFQYLAVDNTPTRTAKASFAPLAGATVEAVNALPGTVLDTAVTDADGQVAFYISNWDWFGTADLFFRVTVDPARAILRQHGRDARWSGTWATWQPREYMARTTLSGAVRSVSGEPGYYPDYGGWALATSTQPLLFNLGTPVLLRASYQTDGAAAAVGGWRPLARGTEVALRTGPGVDFPELGQETFYADADGEVWGTAFELLYGNALEVTLPLALAEDAAAAIIDSIELPRVTTLDPGPWRGRDRDPNNLYWAAFDAAAIGTPAAPVAARCSLAPDHAVAASLHVLKCIRDTHVWLRALTGGDWAGIEGCWVMIVGVDVPRNPPSLGLILTRHVADMWDRWTIVHEFSHGVMWALTPIGLMDFICAMLWGDYWSHGRWKESSEFVALVEGWANLVADALCDAASGYAPSATPPANVWDASGAVVPLTGVPLLGRRIEGCLADALWNWLHGQGGLERCVDVDAIEPHQAGTSGPVPNTTLAPASALFTDGVWTPIKRMQDTWTGYPGTSELLAEAEPSLGSTRWTTLENGYLKPWNLAT